MTVPDLSDLDVFVAVARHRSFRRAAQERGVATSTLSQALRALEERLGARLLNRTTRSVTLTEAGEELLGRLVPALSEVAEALDQVNRFSDTPSGTLRINAPTAAVELCIAPLVARFLAEHPRLKLEIIAEDAFVDVVARGFDAGVRYEESVARDMIAVPIGAPQRLVVVATPDHVAAHGRPMHPTDLLQHACIRRRFLNGSILPWEFEKDGQTLRVSPEGPLTTSNTAVALRAVEGGAGYLYLFEDYVRNALDAGLLISVLDDWCPSFPGPFLYYPSRRHMPSGLRAFIDFVHRERKSSARSSKAAQGSSE
jgi:DNA-binding transcriptional LysR family regulator